MKKGDILTGIVNKVDFPNKGIVVIDDIKITVKNVIEGQNIKFMISKKRNGNYEGRLLEVLEKSPYQTMDYTCKNGAVCGGCYYQTLSYDDQLKIKVDQVTRLLEDQVMEDGGIFEEAVKSPDEHGYRNKMEYSFGDECKGGEMSLGLHKRASTYDVLNCDDCKLVHPDFNAILKTVIDYCREKELSFYKKMAHEGFLRHLLLRRSFSDGAVLVHIVTSSQDPHDFAELKERLLSLELSGYIAGIMHIINDSVADVVQSDETKILYGQDFFYEEVLGLKFKVTTFSFFQTNTHGAEKLYSVARDYLNEVDGANADNVVFDLYSGTGTIAQIVAPKAKKVVAVEIVGEAVEAAKVNAGINGLSNIEFMCNDVLKALDEIEEKPDFIILDPPRDGCNAKALTKILDYGVDNMIYISCKPTSLQRDLKMIRAYGYKVKKVRMVDMFPWTGNLETVCLLSKNR